VPSVRAFGMVSDDAANSFHFLALLIELGTCALAWSAWRRLRSAR
jgi:hypothetical protein